MNLATRSPNQEIWPLGCHSAKILDNIKGPGDKSVPAVFLAKLFLIRQRRVGQATRPAPQSKALGSNRRSCAFKQPTPSVEIAAALASTRAERSLKVVTAVGPSPAFASRAAPRATTACEAQGARPPQSSAVKPWAQASAAATFARQTLLRLNLLQLQRSASASE